MHEVSLGGTIRDYLSGEELPETTYEEVRQALARMLVEEKGYPRERLMPKVGVRFPIDGEQYCRLIDLVVTREDDRPLCAIIFCSGKPATYERETISAARLMEGGPAPLAVATDSREAVLLDVATGDELAAGARALPHYDELLRLAEGKEPAPLTDDRREREQRILYTYSEFLTACCTGTVCMLPGAGRS